MCGIAVILPGSATEPPASAIERMTAALAHRGPDDQACLRVPGCHLGHTRLSVIDPANGRQPMTDPSGRFTIVFNGEVYNHADLRRDLERQGVTFRTRCDTEVLLHGFARWGRGVVPKLNGQFAFAVWDATEQTLFAARDRFGEKPLFWARTPAGHLLLASEVKAIVASGLLRPRLDLTSVDAYLGLYYVPPDRTIYENVHPLPPAHAAECRRDGQLEAWRYWEPKFSCHDVDEAEAVATTRALIERAVSRQTVADVPVGAFLSGGLDSTTVVALMSRQAGGRPVSTFSVGFGDLIDELPFARDVASAYHTDHHELRTEIDVAAMLDRVNDVYDEPFGDSSNIPTFLVAEYARQHVKVVLSGDGGDEVFGGYDWYRPLLADGGDSADLYLRHLGGATALTADRSALWGERSPRPAAEAHVREWYDPPNSILGIDRATAFDVGCYLAGDILVKVDRAAMAHGLETRSPFLDVELAEFVLGLPWQMRFAGQLKHLLRVAGGELWPPSVRGRGKQGFGAPVRHWLARPDVNALWQRVTHVSSPLASLLPGVRSPDVTESLRPQRKWTLLCLGLWLERRAECLASLS